MRPPFSISQITTLGATFEADLRAYAAAGVDGIGIWEIKLPEGGDDQAHEQLEASGLGRAAAVPAVPSILPLPLMEGPADPRERIDAICASVHRLARFEPSSVVCLTGPGDDRDTVVEGLRTIGDEAARAGVRIGLEPINRVGGEDWTSISSLQEAAELLDDADRPALGIQFDSWHVWNTPDARRKRSSVMHTASSVSTSPTGAIRRAAGRTGFCPATASQTSRRSSVRSNVRGGTGSTTWRSFRTTGRLATLGPAPSGMFPKRSWHVGGRRRSSVPGRHETGRRLTRYRPVPCNRPMRTTPRGGTR